MVFGKYVNKYYLKHFFALLLGVIALVSVDYFQLKIPEFYGMVISGMDYGYVEIDGVKVPFDGIEITDDENDGIIGANMIKESFEKEQNEYHANQKIPKYKDEEKDPKYIIDTVFNDLSVGAYIRLGGGCGGMINDFFPGRRLNVPGNSAEMFREGK